MYFRLFEFWRLIAALLIMLYHFSFNGPPGTEWLIVWLQRLRPLLDMFFIISGFLIFLHYGDRVTGWRSYTAYILRRFARLYPLHLITFVLFLLIGIGYHMGFLRPFGGAERYDMAEVIPNLLLVQAWGFSHELTFNFVSWSLSAEWFSYLLLPLILFANRVGGAKGLVVLLLLWIGLLEMLLALHIMPGRHWLAADTWGAWRAFADFIAGALIAVLASRSRLRLTARWPAWLIILASCTLMQLEVDYYYSVIVMGIAVFLAAVCERNDQKTPVYPGFLRPFAAVSFGIYLWHPVVEVFMFGLVWKRLVAPLGIIDFYAFLPIPMAATMIVAVLSYRWFEKPVGNWFLRRLGLKRPASTAAVSPLI
ncbi:acyltransferase [Mesorhizobium sp. RMAD-H1]|uniref:acyltransferase family protein n=1 Tax=Mesorhizobium sp. RMAD-H1 TaxID=2587065 RepID=UPI00160E0BD7|nr:acyltransferase [Mesorhizobium sp. RMAD-H1]MBB2972405.1 peptidoglycan/LPS O-acetylase OafA/YrhL [Mesorhizobium sp. RMAD-H1]